MGHVSPSDRSSHVPRQELAVVAVCLWYNQFLTRHFWIWDRKYPTTVSRDLVPMIVTFLTLHSVQSYSLFTSRPLQHRCSQKVENVCRRDESSWQEPGFAWMRNLQASHSINPRKSVQPAHYGQADS